MIWHNDICPQFHLREMLRDETPMFLCDLTHCRQLHFALDDISKETITLVGNQRNEIRARLGIIIRRQSDGTTVVPLRIVVFHGFLLGHDIVVP